MNFNNIYKDLAKNSRTAYFYGKVVKNQEGNIIDTIVLDTNDSFCRKVRLKEEQIINESINKILQNIKFFWAHIIEKTMNGGGFYTESYIEEFHHMFEIETKKLNDEDMYITLREIQSAEKYNNYEMDLSPSTVWYKDKYGRYVTEDKLKDELLYKNNLKFDEIINAINDAIILFDPERVIYVNNAFENMFGIKDFELFDNPNILFELFDDEYKEKLGIYKYENTYDTEIKIRTRNHVDKWIRYKDYHIENNNDIKEKMTIISDITEKKEADMELERLRMEFFANITHELKTPLNLIFSSLQLLELKARKENKDISKDCRYIRIIRQNALRLLKLVNNLIDSTKIDSNYLDLVYENQDIVYFVEQVFNSIEEYSYSKSLEIIFDTEIEEKVIAFDMDKMERIILNLLSNAIKFNKENGMIYLNIKLKDNFVEISVKDTGIGIQEDKLENVFDRFIQVNDRMRKISEGSGIGLSLTKSLVEMHGGNIEVKSVLNEGTEFIVRIPDNIIDERVDEKINKSINTEYNYFVKKFEVEFSDIY